MTNGASLNDQYIRTLILIKARSLMKSPAFQGVERDDAEAYKWMKRAADQTPAVPASAQADIRAAIKVNEGVLEALRGDNILAGRNEATPPPPSAR